MMRRKAVEQLERRKLSLITGIWANDGLNDDKGTRGQHLEELEEQFEKAAAIIWNPGAREELRDQHRFTEEDEENPFLAPAIKATREIETPVDERGTVKDNLKPGDLEELDQSP